MEHLTTVTIAALGVILLVGALLGALLRRWGQPAVIGQILAGIALGPSGLGHIPGDLQGTLFPAEALPLLSVVGQISLVLFLFAVGYEIDLRILQRHKRSVASVAIGALVPPFLLGAGLGAALYAADLSTGDTEPPVFILYIAISMSITAVPVLAAIIEDRKLSETTAGVVSLAASALVDVVGWLVLAAIVAASSTRSPLVVATVLPIYLVLMLFVVRPLLRSWLWSATSPAHQIFAVAGLVCASAVTTAWLGLHVIFGALLFGLIMPRDRNRPKAQLLQPIEQAGRLLLPAFFITAGLSMDLGRLTVVDVGLLVVVLVVAVLGKFGGALLGARGAGLGWRESAVVGSLMNTRGLTELVVLSVGRQSGIIDVRIYTLLTLMAVIATVATGPLLTFFRADLLPRYERATPPSGHPDELVPI